MTQAPLHIEEERKIPHFHTEMRDFWSRVRESNPPSRLGKPLYYRYTNPALECIIAEANGNIKSFLSKSTPPAPHSFPAPSTHKQSHPKLNGMAFLFMLSIGQLPAAHHNCGQTVRTIPAHAAASFRYQSLWLPQEFPANQ